MVLGTPNLHLYFNVLWDISKFFCPPPLEYYNHIIDREKPSKITIVSTDRVNPVINELLKLHSKAEFYHQSIELDFATVASAQTLVMSYSSFTESAFLASNVVKRCYSMFLGHMLRTDVHRTEYLDKRFISAPWYTSKERDMDLLNWDYRANFIDHSPI